MKIPILMYHSISNSKNPMSLSIDNFEKQMKFMSRNGFKTINLNDKKITDCKKCFLITFDDGYEDIYLNALPILKKYNFNALCFFVTNLIGKKNIWDKVKSDYKELSLMDKEQIFMWLDNEMIAGSHSLDHKDLQRLTYNEKISQITEPINFFKINFNINIKYFSYPFGSYDDDSLKIVKKYYKFAMTTKRSRFSTNIHNNHEIPRIPINKKDGIFKFYLKINTIYEDLKF